MLGVHFNQSEIILQEALSTSHCTLSNRNSDQTEIWENMCSINVVFLDLQLNLSYFNFESHGFFFPYEIIAWTYSDILYMCKYWYYMLSGLFWWPAFGMTLVINVILYLHFLLSLERNVQFIQSLQIFCCCWSCKIMSHLDP